MKELDRILKERKITEREFAKSIGVANSTISRICRSDAIPHWDLACKIADTLGIKLDELRDKWENNAGRRS